MVSGKVKKNSKICPSCQDWIAEDAHLVDKECDQCKELRLKGGVKGEKL